MLTDLDLEEFQKLCVSEFHLDISKQEATKYWNSIINLLITVSSNKNDDA